MSEGDGHPQVDLSLERYLQNIRLRKELGSLSHEDAMKLIPAPSLEDSLVEQAVALLHGLDEAGRVVLYAQVGEDDAFAAAKKLAKAQYMRLHRARVDAQASALFDGKFNVGVATAALNEMRPRLPVSEPRQEEARAARGGGSRALGGGAGVASA